MSGSGKAVPLYFITGFLGSGKTTLLNRILDEARERGMKLGVIINEWGKVSIDAGLVQGDHIEIEELNDGQVFCSCLAGDFVKVLGLYAERPLDAVVVETSGMANPLPLYKILRDLERVTGSHYDYRGMTALVDPENFLELIGIINAVEEQVLASQRIIINKIDLADPSALPDIRAKIAKINPDAVVVETSHAQIDGFFDFVPPPAKPAGLGALAAPREAKQPYQRPGQYVLTTAETLDPNKVAAFMRGVLPYALRVKGTVKDEAGSWFYVDGVNDRVEVKPLNAKGTVSKIVVIPKGGMDLEKKTADEWKKACGVPVSFG